MTLGNTVMKGNARAKVRRLYGDKVLAGFAGGTGRNAIHLVPSASRASLEK